MIQDVNAFRAEMRAKARALAREDLYAFYRYQFPVLAPEATFLEAFHFRALAEAMKKVVAGETPRLLIAVPPRHGKSLLGSVALTAWILGRQPSAKIICGSYGATDEAGARVTAQADTGYGDDAQLLGGPSPQDEWVLWEPPADIGGSTVGRAALATRLVAARTRQA